MAEMISYCGLDCNECGARIATVNDDDAKRVETAALWSNMYKVDIKPENVNCHGCRSPKGPHFSHCDVCKIRGCGLDKEVTNCAHCADYACGILEEHFQMAPECRTALDGIRSKL